MPVPATCAACLRRTPLFTCARPAGIYEGSLRDALHALKFDGCRALAAPLGDLITRAVRAEASLGADVVVPVPLHPSRLRERGFNQAELLAHRVARTLHLPCHTHLVRRRLTAPQSTLARTGREANVLGAFSCAGGLIGATVLLVDDVMSTGNTASACAGALLEAGAARVVVATVAAALLGGRAAARGQEPAAGMSAPAAGMDASAAGMRGAGGGA